MKKNRPAQIGLIGSDSDLNDDANVQKMAFDIGELLAKKRCVLITSGEQRGGLTKKAAEGALKAGGCVIGIMGDKTNSLPNLTAIVEIGTNKEGLREFFLINSCDAVIAIGGGSGTLNELTIAYQNKVPVVCVKKSQGWASKLAGKYLDKRKFYKFETALTPDEAVEKAMRLSNMNLI